MRRPTQPSLLACVAALFVTKCSIRWFGFARTLRMLKRRATHQGLNAEVDNAVDTIAARVAVAAAFYPGRARCLEQSLVLLYLLRRRGIEATLRLGVQPYAFQSHAWVECGGVPVNEGSEVLRKLVLLPELPS